MITGMAVVPPFRNVLYRSIREKEISNVKYEGSFTIHGSEVWFCSIHPTLNVALSASSNNKVFIWDLDNKSIYFHDTVSAITGLGFSKDGDYFFICSQPRLIQVYCFQLASVSKLRDLILGQDAVWIKWHTTMNTIYCGCEDGRILYWRVPKLFENSLMGNSESCHIADMSRNGFRLVVGHLNGAVRIWNLPNRRIEFEVLPGEGLRERAHSVAAYTSLYVAVSYKKIMVLTARAILWTVIFPQDLMISCIASPLDGRSSVIAIGTANNKLMIMNIMNKVVTETLQLSPKYGSITCLKWISDEVVVASTTTGDVFAINVRTHVQQFSLHGHNECLVGFETRQSDKRIVTVSTDTTLNVYTYK